jgi:hypothetical protein
MKIITIQSSPGINYLKLGHSENQFEKAYYDPFSRRLDRKPIGPRSSNFFFVRDWPFVATLGDS